MLREYLLHDLTPADCSWMKEYDKERLLDDFVCLMILLGDDFLPELPSLDINEGSVQYIINTYQCVPHRALIIGPSSPPCTPSSSRTPAPCCPCSRRSSASSARARRRRSRTVPSAPRASSSASPRRPFPS